MVGREERRPRRDASDGEPVAAAVGSAVIVAAMSCIQDVSLEGQRRRCWGLEDRGGRGKRGIFYWFVFDF